MAEQATTSPSDEVDLSATFQYNPHTTFHPFPNLPVEIQVMIWKENLPQQDDFRPFTVAESEEKPRTICLVSVTNYPSISLVCRAARRVAISHLPIALPSVPGHSIRIHSRTTVCLKFDEIADDGFRILVRYFKNHNIPSFMAHVNRLKVHLWCFGELYFGPLIWRQIIEACPNLTSITAFKSSAGSRRRCLHNESSFADFLNIQRATKRWSAVKPEFWLYGVEKTVKIDGVGEDGENTITDTIIDVLHQLSMEETQILGAHMRSLLKYGR
jgi:hypothetical protein